MSNYALKSLPILVLVHKNVHPSDFPAFRSTQKNTLRDFHSLFLKNSK